VRFLTRFANEAVDDKFGEMDPSAEGRLAPRLRPRSLSIGTRMDLIFLSVWLAAAGVALIAFVIFCLYGFLMSFSF
jgi:hypothetical protein